MQQFLEAARSVAAAIRGRPATTRWFLASDNDADGLCAAAVTAMALLKAGQPRFTIRPSRDKTAAAYAEILASEWDGLILLDKGTSHVAQLAAGANGRPIIVVDHHNLPPGPVPEGVLLLNPRAEGLDGSRDASAATTAQALALALCGDAALAWAPTALAGAVGDWQHMGGWQGWNRELVGRARAAGHLRIETVPAFIGTTLPHALSHARPPIPGLHGDVAACERFLAAIGVDATLEVEELGPEPRTRLLSAVVALHLAEGASPAMLADVVAEREVHARLDRSLRQVFRVVDACGRLGEGGTGIAWLMGDATARDAALALHARYRDTLDRALRRLRDEGAQPRAACQVAWTEEADFTGMVAGVGMTHVVRDRSRPLCVLAHRADGALQVSTRGLHGHVEAGMDLGRACHVAAQAVGAEGGGHPVAAGAVVPATAAEAFLAALDAELARQGFLGKRAEPERAAGPEGPREGR